ncbi:MAG: hypothetical protein II339_01760 [Spirochaetales bacterium]|nr:hypothetical protein [Spirochaetales bacterium]
MNREKLWKSIAIISSSLLIVVIATSSSLYFNATLADVCNELDAIASYLQKIYLKI